MKKIKILLTIVCVLVVITGLIYRNNRNQKRDYNPPLIVVGSDTVEVTIKAKDEELLEGVTAYDEKDGDVTKNIVIEKIKKNIEGEYNEFTITYVCFDESGNVGRLERKLVYSDYEKPHFVLEQDLRFPLNTTINLFDYISAVDSLDDNISPFITIDGTKDLGQITTPGNYFYNISVTNSVGDTAELPIQVELYEDSYEEQMFKPKLFLKEYLVYIDEGEKFVPEDYLDYIEDGGRCLIEADDEIEEQEEVGEDATIKLRRIPLSEIGIESSVNSKKTGVYSVVYKYKSTENGYDCSTKMIVVVE